MVFESQPGYLHPVNHLLVGSDHLALHSVFHQFAEDIVGIYVDANHDVPVASLGGHREGSSLVRMNLLRQFVNFYEDVIHFLVSDGFWRRVLCSWLDFYFTCWFDSC